MFQQLVEKNRSYRGFDESVTMTTKQLEELVALARICPCGVNRQPLKYFISADKSLNDVIYPCITWAGLLKGRLPYPNTKPAGYIVICADTNIAPNPSATATDVGIVAQTMLLGATEMGLGGCMLGAVDMKKLAEIIKLDPQYVIRLVLAIGKPNETVVLTEAIDGDVKYYRTDDDIHYVPKRPLSELIIK